MLKIFFSTTILLFVHNIVFSQTPQDTMNTTNETIVCKLTSAELQVRRDSVLSKIKELVLEKKELEKGYAFKFEGSDATIDMLIDFIKSERKCCGFFKFALTIKDEETDIWLEITGPALAKEFITEEMGF